MDYTDIVLLVLGAICTVVGFIFGCVWNHDNFQRRSSFSLNSVVLIAIFLGGFLLVLGAAIFWNTPLQGWHIALPVLWAVALTWIARMLGRSLARRTLKRRRIY